MRALGHVWRHLTAGLSGVVTVVALCACAGEPAAPSGEFRITADAPDVVAGGLLGLVATVDGRRLGAEEVQWLSRDPSTVVVRGGVARGVFPGTAWAVARHRGVLDSLRIVVRFADLRPGDAGIRIGSESSLIRLTGVSVVSDLVGNLPPGSTTSIIASSGKPGILDPCCQIFGDTVVQVNFGATPVVGTRALVPPVTTIETRIGDQLVRRGSDDVVLMLRNGSGSTRFYIPVKPATLEITRVELGPVGGPTGILSGRIAFEAAAILERPTAVPGHFEYTPVGDRTTTVYVDFSTPLRHETFTRPGAAVR